MKFKSFFSKLNVRIALAFFILSMFIVSVFTALSYYSTFDILTKEDEERTRESIVQAADYIHAYLNKLKSFSDIIAMHTDIKGALSDADTSALDSISSLINIAKSSDPRIKSISVVSRHGLVITSESGMAVPISDDMMHEQWYQKALESSEMPVLASTGHGIFEMDDGDWIVSVFKEIVSDDNMHLGIVVMDVSYKFIEDYIQNLQLGSSGYIFILSENKEVIYHPDKNVLENMHTLHIEDIAGLSYNIPIPDSGWMMYGVHSQDNIKLLQSRVIKNLLLSMVSAALLSVLLGSIVSFFLSDPIRKLTRIMTQADTTWEHISIDQHSSYEVLALTNEYNQLMDRIKLLTESIAKKEADRREFELKALQSQINPHFLYNTLDTIIWNAELNELQTVVQVTSSLAGMLRISLRSNTDFLPLEIELEHCKRYLEIQKTRYDTLFTYEIEENDALSDILVPKLILQPIVENAIYHGIRGKKANGWIRITYTNEEDILKISISDNGIGFPKEKMSEFDLSSRDSKHFHRESGEKRNSSGGIGLHNVISRIQILCGSAYGLQIHTQENVGTCIVLCLPIRKQLWPENASKKWSKKVSKKM